MNLGALSRNAAAMSAVNTRKGVLEAGLEVFKFGCYVAIPIVMIDAFAYAHQILEKIIRNVDRLKGNSPSIAIGAKDFGGHEELYTITGSTTPWWSKDTVTVVTGSNKGIGYEIVRSLVKAGLTVILTARDKSKGQPAIDALKAEGLDIVYFHKLEVSSPKLVQALASWLKSKFGGIDILMNNDGVKPNGLAEYEKAKGVLSTNYSGVKTVMEGLLPFLRASPEGARIINTTTRLVLYERSYVVYPLEGPRPPNGDEMREIMKKHKQ